MLQVTASIVLAIFFVVMIGIGIFSSKKVKNVNEFLLGGRNIGPWMSAFAYGTSYFSAVIFIGYAGKTGWGIGLGGIWIGIGNALLGSLLAWMLLAKKTRVMTNTLGASTMPEFFEARFGDTSMKFFSAIIIFLFLVPYASSVYMGLGYLFSSVFPGASEIYAMLIIAVLTLIYLVLGGYVATAITDFVQGIIMLAGVVIMIFSIVYSPQVGGLTSGINKLAEIAEDGVAVGANLSSIWGGSNWFALLSLVFLTSFGTWGLPQMIHKFYAIKNQDAIKRATVISTAFALIIATGAYLAGSFSRIILNNQLPAEGFDNVIPQVLTTLFSGNIGGNILLSVILILVLSASMSTLAAVILTSSSAVTVDIIGHLRPNSDKRKTMGVMRGFCVLFVALSLIVAIQKIGFIVALMSFSWGILSGSFIGPYIWGLYSKKTTRAGAWAGMLVGLCTVLICVMYSIFSNPEWSKGFDAAKANSPSFGMYAMILSFIVVPIVSYFTPKLSDSHIEKVFAAEPPIKTQSKSKHGTTSKRRPSARPHSKPRLKPRVKSGAKTKTKTKTKGKG